MSNYKNRNNKIDLLKGCAMFGVITVNFFSESWSKNNPIGFDNNFLSFFIYLFSDESWSLLAILFGYGMNQLILKYEELKEPHPYLLQFRRILFLFLIGLFNAGLFWGDILVSYTIVSCIAYFFINKTKEFHLISGLFLLIIINPFLSSFIQNLTGGSEFISPSNQTFSFNSTFISNIRENYLLFYKTEIIDKHYLISIHLHMLSMMFIGIGLSKSKIDINKFSLRIVFKSIMRNYSFFVRFCTFFFIMMYFISAYFDIHFYDANYIVKTLILTIFIFILIASFNKNRFVKYISAIGSMSLSCYLMQNILMIPIFWNIHPLLRFNFSYPSVFLLSIGIYSLQAYLCNLWLNYYQKGPVEWLWRCFIYWNHIPNRKINEKE
jgi:uncharacterized protein